MLQEIWSSILAAILGSYLAMKIIERAFSKFDRNMILFLYSGAFLAFLVWSLYVMFKTAPSIGFGVKEFSIQILTPFAAIVTAILSLKEKAIDEDNNHEDYEITDDDYE